MAGFSSRGDSFKNVGEDVVELLKIFTNWGVDAIGFNFFKEHMQD